MISESKKAKTIIKKSDNEEKKLIKRNWKKITIIVSILLIFLIGISVGFYFIFRPDKFNFNSETLNGSEISIKKAKEKILENDTEDNVGLFFYKENGDATNYMTYGDTTGSKGDYSEVEGIGPFSYWLDKQDESKTKWYSINIDKKDNLEEDLFLVDNNNDGYELDTRMIDGDWSEGFNFENDVSKDTKWEDANKLELDVQEGKEEDKKEDYKGWKVVSRDGEDPSPEGNELNPLSAEQDFNIAEGSTMIFDTNGKIKGLSNGYDYSTPIDHDNEEDYRSSYETFFNSFVDINNYD